MGAEELGKYATYVALVSIFTLIGNLGFSDTTVQWLAAATARGERGEQEELIRRCSGYHVLLEGPFLAVVVFFLLVHQSLTYSLLAAFATFLTQAVGTAAVVLTATARNAVAAKLGLASTLAAQFAIAAAAASTHRGVAVYAVQAIAALAAPGLLLFAVGQHARGLLLRPTLRPWVGRDFVRYAAATSVSSLLGLVVFGRSELLVLHSQHRGLAAGLFVVATGLAGQITIPMDSLMAPLAPTAAGVLSTDPKRAGEVLLRALRVTAIFGALTMTAAVPLGALLLPTIYGQFFSNARGAFVALGVTSCFQSLVLPVTAVALALRLAPAAAWANLVAVVADVVLAVALIPHIALAGAVIANVASQVLSLAILCGLLSHRLRLRPADLFQTAAPFVVAASTVTLAELVIAHVHHSGALTVGLTAAPLLILLGALAVYPRMQMPQTELAYVLERLPRALRRPTVLIANALPLAHTSGYAYRPESP